MKRRVPALAVALVGLVSCAPVQGEGPTSAHEPIVGLPCEGCEAVFVGMPDPIVSETRIAPENEPSEPMRIEGTVRDAQGRPAPGVVVYAYHTDAEGIYPAAATRHGRLRGWARTDALGKYRFVTIRPAAYPHGEIPAHVHMHVLEPDRCTYYIDSIHFVDDPYLSEDEKKTMATGRGGSALVVPRKDNGVWVVTRDIVLGERIPRYP